MKRRSLLGLPLAIAIDPSAHPGTVVGVDGGGLDGVLGFGIHPSLIGPVEVSTAPMMSQSHLASLAVADDAALARKARLLLGLFRHGSLPTADVVRAEPRNEVT